MALGTYDQEERKRKVVYNADGTTNEEKADRSVVSAAPVQGDALAANPDLAKALPVTQAPQPQTVAPQTVAVNGTQQNIVGATPPPVQNGGTFQESQSNVNSGGDIKNNQGEVNQGTGTSLESQVGPESSAGAENVQWAGAPQGDVTSTYNNIISPPQATPPLNAPVREFGGFSFSTVTPTGKALTDSDMDAYFGMLKKKSEETGEPIEYLDKLAGNLLVGKTQAESEYVPQLMHTITRVPDAENGKNTTTNGATGKPQLDYKPDPTKANGTGASPSVLDYQRLSADTLRAMSSLERDPEKKKTIDAALAIKGEGRFDTPSINGEKESTGNDANTANGDVKDKFPELTEPEKKDKEDAKTALKEKYGSGNVDMDKRYVVSEKQMRDKGWVGARGNQSVYPQLKKIKDSTGKVHNVLLTPIRADGTILSPDMLDQYVESLKDAEDIVERDKALHGIVLKLDATDADVDEMDDLLKKAINGELVTELTAGDGDMKAAESDPWAQSLKSKADDATKAYEDAAAKLADPNRHVNDVLLEDLENRKKSYEEETEVVKKRQKRSRLIANIGDVLQGFANLAGAWYGAKSSELTSLSASAGAAGDKELSQREKRREELEKSVAKAREELDKGAKANVDVLMKRMEKANEAYEKYITDTAKSAKASRQRMAEEKEKRMMMVQRDAVNWAQRDKLETKKSNLRREEMAIKHGYTQAETMTRESERRKTKQTPGAGGKSGKNGKPKKSEGSLK